MFMRVRDVVSGTTGLHGRPGEFFVQSMSVANHAEATPPARVADEMIRTRRRFHVRGGWRHAERGEDAWHKQRLAGTRNAVVQQSAQTRSFIDREEEFGLELPWCFLSA